MDNFKEKPKTSVKRIAAIINVAFAAVFLAAVSVYMAVQERPEISEIERRKLAEMPEFSSETYLSGEYAKNLSVFYNDTVPHRDYFKTLSSRFKGLLGISFNDAEFYFDDPITDTPATTPAETTVTMDNETTDTEPSDTEPDTTAETAPPETTEDDNAPEIEVNNNIFVLYIDGHWRAMPRYMGGSGNNFADSLNAYKKDLGNDVNMYTMIIPTQEEYYLPSKYSDYIASHFETIENIKSRLLGVTNVDAYSVLNEHKSEPIYTRTDHHWQPLGAYYAAGEFTKTAGAPFSDISTYERVDVEGFLGTLYGITQSPKLLDDPEVFTYYKPSNDYTAYYYTTDYTYEFTFPLFVNQPVSGSYSTFMGGDQKIVRVETDVKNGRKLAIWKDSYGNALVPFLTGSFEEIFVLDIRYFDLNAIDFMKENGITDVLFTMCTFTAADVTRAEYMEENRTR